MTQSDVYIDGVQLIDTTINEDVRGSFYESWNYNNIRPLISDSFEIVQENISVSQKNVIRGLHYQVNTPQGKLVRVVRGAIWDVVVDLRESSSSFGRWQSFDINETNNTSLWIPEGCAHGFLSLDNKTTVVYGCTNYYSPDNERTIIWNDSTLSINWPIDNYIPVISNKDLHGVSYADAPKFP